MSSCLFVDLRMSSCFSPGISRVRFFKFLHSTFLRREKGINFDENLPGKKCSDESSLFLPSSVPFNSPHTCSVTRFDFLILGKLNSGLFKFMIFAFCKQELIEKFEMDIFTFGWRILNFNIAQANFYDRYWIMPGVGGPSCIFSLNPESGSQGDQIPIWDFLVQTEIRNSSEWALDKIKLLQDNTLVESWVWTGARINFAADPSKKMID